MRALRTSGHRPAGWLIVSSVLAAVFSVATPASAEAPSLEDRPGVKVGRKAVRERGDIPRVEDGEGITVGRRSTFHPGAALALGFDSNVFFANPNDGGGIQRAGVLLPTAWLGLGNREVRDGVLQTSASKDPSKFDYNLRAAFGFRQFLSGNDNVRGQSRPQTVVDAHVEALPGRRFSVALDNTFLYLSEPRNYEANPEFNYNRLEDYLALSFIIRPGGGRLSLSASYLLEALRYTSFDLITFDRIVNGAATELKWRIAPKSALVANYTFHYTYYTACCSDPGSGRNEDNYAHRAKFGYRGVLGQRWVLQVMAGYGKGIYFLDNNGPEPSVFLLDLNLGFYPTPRTEVYVEGGRSFQDSLFGNYFKDLGGWLGAVHTFRWRMFMDLSAGVIQRRYAGIPIPFQDLSGPAPGQAAIGSYRDAAGFVREDILYGVRFRLEQPFGRYYVLALRYNLLGDATGFAINYVTVPPDRTPPPDFGAYTKHVVMLVNAVRF